jgi:lipooligosaccharide transport system permease protein
MYFFSGIFFPLASLPGWAQAVAWCLPLTHAVALSRACVAGTLGGAALVHLAVLLLVLAASYGLAVRWVGRRLIA